MEKKSTLNPTFRRLWLGWGLAFFLFEGWAIRNKTQGDTLTEHVRHYFQVKGKVGSFVFLGLFGTFASWFAVHILKPVAQKHNF